MSTRAKDSMDAVAFENKAEEWDEDLEVMATRTGVAGRKKAQKNQDAATEQYSDVRGHVSSLDETLEAYVKEHPIKALLIAFAVGFTYAKCSRRH